jgi:hypothetical protein
MLFALATATMMFLSLSSGAVIVPGNPDCCSINPDNTPDNNIGLKINQSGMDLNGTWYFTGTGSTEITCNKDIFNGSNAWYITITTTDGIYFDWESNIPLDAVIVKGGSTSNVFYYDPEATSGSGLQAPLNSSGSPAEVSHLEVCFDFELTISKTAVTSYARTFEWDIEKSVSPDEWYLFDGDQATSAFEVILTQTGYTDSGWAVDGLITVENNTPFDALITGIDDMISGNITVTPACGITFPYMLPAGETLVCKYNTALPDGTQRLNTATVYTDPDGMVGGASATANVIFGDPTNLVNDQVTVTDDMYGNLGTYAASAGISYTWLFDCDDAGENVNTATIVETGQYDQATVDVYCYSLNVSKDAATSLTRTYDWWAEKLGSDESLVLAPGQVYDVTYQIQVFAGYTDSDWAVTGNIYIQNPAPVAAVINDVTDLVSPDIAAMVDCSVEFPYMLAAGETLTCSYSAVLPDASPRSNTATVTLQNYFYYADGTADMNGTTDFSGMTPFDFDQAVITEVDKCIDLSDNMYGDLGNVCHDDLPYNTTYTITFGPYSDPDDCGYFEVVNTVSFVTGDNGVTGYDSYTLGIDVACSVSGGCTLTIGYWKTHSTYGPAPYDENWMNLGDADGDGIMEGQDEDFFLSGKTYYEVLWTPPAGGNVYYILAHQYIAAELNILNGADPADALLAFNAAYNLLSQYTPAYAATLKGKNKKAWTDPAAVLDDYNNGLIGPGHCDDNTSYFQSGEVISFDDELTEGDDGYILMQNYPNPFASNTTFRISIPESMRVEMNVYSITGQKIASIYSGVLSEGTHTIGFDMPTGFGPGMYLYSLETPEKTIYKKMSVY